MAKNDIYNNERKYRRQVSNYLEFGERPDQRSRRPQNSKYHCLNRDNLEHFPTLFRTFEARDLSFVRRNRLIATMRFVCGSTPTDLSQCDRSDVDAIISAMHRTYRTVESKKTIVRDMKCIWRWLFPERDEHGRVDESTLPHPVRHLTGRFDKSQEEDRGDRLTLAVRASLVAQESRAPTPLRRLPKFQTE